MFLICILSYFPEQMSKHLKIDANWHMKYVFWQIYQNEVYYLLDIKYLLGQINLRTKPHVIVSGFTNMYIFELENKTKIQTDVFFSSACNM